MSEKKRRWLLRMSLSISASLAVLWIVSAVSICSLGYSSLSSVNTISSGGIGFYGGEISVGFGKMPLVLAKLWHPQANATGFHVNCQRLPTGMAFQWGFHQRHIKQNLPVRADGSPSVNAAGRFVPGASTVQFEDSSLSIPIWFPLAIVSAHPLWTLIGLATRRRQNRFATGQCVQCGYDLRASPERCPECGSVPIATTQVQTLPAWLTSGDVRRVFVCGIVIVSVVGIALAAREMNIAYGYRSLDFLSRWR